MDSFIKAKVYGAPYLPRDFAELSFLVNIYFHQLKVYVVNLAYSYLHLHNCATGYVLAVRDIVFVYLVYVYVSRVIVFIRGYGIVKAAKLTYHSVGKRVFAVMLTLPPLNKKIQGEVAKTTATIELELMKNSDELLQFPLLPAKGLDSIKVSSELDQLQNLKHSDWANGRVSGAVYHGGKAMLDLQSDAYSKYAVANQLHPDVFPGVRKMEAEVVSMVLKLFNAPEEGCGSTTSGGTESLLLAGLAAREYGRRYRNTTRPEVIAPVTIHAGIEKACYYFGMKLHKVDLDPVTYQVDTKKVERLINSNTVLLVGSAPNYPHGIIDDIELLSKIAVKHKLLLHVDACLGSFIVSFLEKSKVHSEPVPVFDFRLPGVTSISCDTHKYGFAPKGSSIIMYRNARIRECQYYVLSDWVGGMYGSPTLAGSRPGALVVGCWATLVNIGEDGYTKSCLDIVNTTMKLKYAIMANETLSQYLEIIGNPLASVIAFKPKKHVKMSIYQLGDRLNEKGWHFASLQRPAALHFAVTKLTVPVVDELIQDLIETTEVLAKEESTDTGDTAALYGVAGSVATSGVADQLIVAFLDTLFKV